MKKYFFLILALIGFCRQSIAQTTSPSVALQSGFSFFAQASFRFSPGGHWLEGSNEGGEYVIWDVQSGKQLQHFTPWTNTFPDLAYQPVDCFSNDDHYLLMPAFPLGIYYLYDLIGNKYTVTFKPQDDEWFTNATFSPDGKSVLLIAEKGGEVHTTELFTYDLQGNLISRIKLDLPPFVLPAEQLMKLLMHRAYEAVKNSCYVYTFTTDDQLRHLYFSTIDGKTYALSLQYNTNEYHENNFWQIKGLPLNVPLKRMKFYKGTLMATAGPRYDFTDKTKKRIIMTDTLYQIDQNALIVKKKLLSTMLIPDKDQRSVGVPGLPISSAENLGTYFESHITTTGHYQLTGKDVITDEQVFSLESGDPHYYYTRSDYHPGQLNGGYISALSDDRKFLAEYSLILLIHNLSGKDLQSEIPATKGQMKIGAPVFLDSARIFFPKAYNDGFVMDLRTGGVEHLKKTQDCQDTLNHGANIYYSYDNSQQLGLQNAFISAGNDRLITTNVAPNSACHLTPDREITVWNPHTLSRVASYNYSDREYTYTLGGLAGEPRKFLVNYKLVDFEKPDKPVVTPLMIVHKRDTFLVSYPVYLPKEKMIFGIAGTRTKPGNPNLMFTWWDLNGKLVKQIVQQRPKSKMEYQTLITKAFLSPDSSKFMYCLYDGTGGTFDLKTQSVTYNFEHGKMFDNSLAHIHVHNNITAACFIDDQHFVTNGENGMISQWTIGAGRPDKTINTYPGYFISLTLSPDKRYLVGVTLDKTAHFIDIRTGADVAQFIASGPDASTLLDQRGFYLTSRKSVNDVSFFYNGKPYEFSQFDPLMNRPADVLQRLGYIQSDYFHDLDAIRRKRIQKLKVDTLLTPGVTGFDAPVVRLSNLPHFQEQHPDKNITFNLNAQDQLHKVTHIHVTVNGNPVFGSSGLLVKPAGNVTMPLSFELSPGMNNIVVSAENDKGTESLRQTFSVNGAVPTTKPDLYIVAIGCSNYLQKQHQLAYAVKDARDIITLFKKQSQSYSRILVDTLFNQNVTPAKIMAVRNQLLSSHPNDRIVIYFAGHGLQDNNLRYYLSTFNTDFQHSNIGSLPFEQFERLVDSIPARNKLLLIDVCNSGEVDREALSAKANGSTLADRLTAQEKANQLTQLYFTDLRRSNGASELGASGPFEQATETSDLQNGVFTYFLKKGLKEMEADLNHDGQVTVSELADYLKDKVGAYTDKAQQPTLRRQNINSDMVVWQ